MAKIEERTDENGNIIKYVYKDTFTHKNETTNIKHKVIKKQSNLNALENFKIRYLRGIDAQIEERFNKKDAILINNFSIFQPNMFPKNFSNLPTYGLDEINKLID
jgi:hypothetical protein